MRGNYTQRRKLGSALFCSIAEGGCGCIEDSNNRPMNGEDLAETMGADVFSICDTIGYTSHVGKPIARISRTVCRPHKAHVICSLPNARCALGRPPLSVPLVYQSFLFFENWSILSMAYSDEYSTVAVSLK